MQTSDLGIEYQFKDSFKIDNEMKKKFDQHGCLIVRGLLDREELNLAWKTLDGENGLLKHAYETTDADGKKLRRITFDQPGDDVTGLIIRSEKIAGACEQLMGGEIYNYTSLIVVKEPRHGGEFFWHQDYGYWYDYGVLFPDLLSAFIALEPCRKENGCLQVIPGSHRCGRLNHSAAGGLQTGADMQRVNELLKVLPETYVELEPGDVLFFHGNTLHKSNANISDQRRTILTASFNMAWNNPLESDPHSKYVPLVKVPNESIKTCKNFTDFTGKEIKYPLKEEKSSYFPVDIKS